MSGILSVLQELYIRFMVWLGAEPPAGYEHLLKKKPPIKKPAPPPPPKPAPKPPVEPPPAVAKPQPPAPAKPEPPAPVIEKPDKEWLEARPPVVEEKPAPPAAPAEVVAPPVEEIEEEPAPPPAEVAAPPAKEIEREPVPAEVIAPPAEELVFKYEVQRGDTLNAVARRYGLTVKELLDANDIANADRIYPGQKLIIPGYMLPSPELETEAVPLPVARPAADDNFIYTVASGDTLNSIAKRYGITVLEIIEANTLADPQRIKLGQKLIIPGVVKSAHASMASDPDFPPVGSLKAVRALYVSYFAAGHSEARQGILDLLTGTELNAVVIDAKSDMGLITYPTKNSLARDIGAHRPAVADFADLMAQFKQNGIYTIARFSVFKDLPLAQHRPELAVKTSSGGVWPDNDKNYWCDPFLQPVWDYNIQLAIEAAQMGFDEIHFDAVRFPAKSEAGSPQFSQDVTKDSRTAAINGFLSSARGQLAPFGVKVSARVVGYTCWRKDDSVIGQDIEQMSDYLDVLCPMLAPSTFHAGIPGYKIAVEHPYEVVFESAQRAIERLRDSRCEVRPWLQDFQDYRFDRRMFGKTEIQAQIRGSFEAGCTGFMMWNPNAAYSASAYAPVSRKR